MKTQPKHIIIDFDSTIVKLEGLDELAKIALADHPNNEAIVTEMEEITRLGMEGKIPFNESLARRLKLFKANKTHIAKLVGLLRANITKSLLENRDFLITNKDRIIILSGGFKEWIDPIMKELGVPAERVYANTFEFDDDGNVIGADNENPLSWDNGKVEQIKLLNLEGEVMMIGDGYTDYKVRQSGVATRFLAFTENVARQQVIEVADGELKSFAVLAIYEFLT
jgi:D-3-phosphoglycerate dehydrogenase